MDKILERINLTRRDLNDLNPDLIQEMFLNLSISEISLLCRVSRSFDAVCQRESLWQTKIWSDYGVDKKYGETWRETAKLMTEVNMINLNKKWVNGETYKHILTKAWNKGKRGIIYLIKLQLNAFYDIIPNENVAVKLQYTRSDIDSFKEVIEHIDINRESTNDAFDRFMKIRSKEFTILIATFTVLEKTYPLLPSASYESFNGKIQSHQKNIIEIKDAYFSIIKLIDPILYIMQFSVFSKHDLREVRAYKFAFK